jgi:hypothetical protein
LRCANCEEPILEGEALDPAEFGPAAHNFHRECLIRMVAGSYGHQIGQCSCYGGALDDPPGLTTRQAAKVAAALFMFLSGFPEPGTPNLRWPLIDCPLCHWTSYNPNDVANRYCGHCHVFHELIRMECSECGLEIGADRLDCRPAEAPRIPGDSIGYCPACSASVRFRVRFDPRSHTEDFRGKDQAS